ncbi:DUF4279 domain-containing protein [Leptospira sp. GIMC2001]|uniref:DUF4279 domain-containing protein n=1 Tax=Leptospira sp. GIMC2001 TaxID=1513297 RepID=UPI00234AAFDA|nr:DUF4279 domain-containing protein [Leptospira sp. GIMC2001]WCL50676.1 DUF4279 domain-containing protein [Leptospira sp. GIMC2001]
MEILIKKARNEISKPSLAITQQYLDVNIIDITDGEYTIERIAKFNENTIIYFKISEEKFYLGITIDNSTSEVIHSFIENGNKCYLSCVSYNLSLEQLSKLTKLKYTSGWTKGDFRKDLQSKYDFTRINFELLTSECFDTENAINELLKILETDIPGINNLSSKSDACISICKHQYISSNAGLHIDLKTINRLAKLNLPLDIDTYIVGAKILDE